MSKSSGSVYIIGAGPGDLEYLTLKALRLLQKADVVLLDSLVNPAIVKYLRKDTRVIYVGKRGGIASTPQSQICDLMISLTRQGFSVARVKGGDPFIFGRAGEELAALSDAGIKVEVCSGISAGLAIPSDLGIPLTDRELAHSCVFITGNQKEGSDSFDWDALVRVKSTIVAFMALSKISALTSCLLDAGLAANTPAVAVQDGTLPEQKIVFAPLSNLPARVKRAQLVSPTLLIVGNVVSLSPLWSDHLYGPNDSLPLVSEIAAGTKYLAQVSEIAQ